jgi:uncharacterized protein (TIGR02996 family)
VVEQDFTRRIMECPEDEAVRLVFADWLDEHGDPERAAYLRLGHDGRRDKKWYSIQVPNSLRPGEFFKVSRCRCPSCGGDNHEVRNHSLMWHDGDVFCMDCGAYVWMYDAG